MSQVARISILTPLAVAASAVVFTILIHALSVNATVRFVQHEDKVGRVGISFWTDVAITTPTIVLVLIAHLIEIGVWAGLFVVCGEFRDFGTAYYHSAVNYTTLGYGDMVMSPSWRMLGPLEAANGALMFGVSTGMVFALIQMLISARLARSRAAAPVLSKQES
jgi:hypothetical protein